MVNLDGKKLNKIKKKGGTGMDKKLVFVIGDSISCYYGRHLEGMLKEMWKYDRKGGKHTFKDIDDGTSLSFRFSLHKLL